MARARRAAAGRQRGRPRRFRADPAQRNRIQDEAPGNPAPSLSSLFFFFFSSRCGAGRLFVRAPLFPVTKFLLFYKLPQKRLFAAGKWAQMRTISITMGFRPRRALCLATTIPLGSTERGGRPAVNLQLQIESREERTGKDSRDPLLPGPLTWGLFLFPPALQSCPEPGTLR